MLNSIQQFIQEFPELLRSLFLVAFPVFNPNHKLYFIYTIVFIVFILGVYYIRESKSNGFALRKALAYCFPKSLYTQQSAILDYQCYLINGLLAIIVSLTAFFTLSQITSDFVNLFLCGLFGKSEIQVEMTLALKIVYTIFAVLVTDLGVFFAHYLLHKIPVLWEFHKAHHLAEGLNPITGFRYHPIDIGLKQTMKIFFMGIYMGIFSYFVNQEIKAITIAGLLISSFLYRFIIHLRHSHIWISFGWHLSHIFQSPAMHHIHHSEKIEHYDKNFGLIFSFWDYIFGTIYVPKVREELTIGLGESDYHNIWQLYYVPFLQAYKQVSKSLNRLANNN